MTHPLTDEILCRDFVPGYTHEGVPLGFDGDDMRAAFNLGYSQALEELQDWKNVKKHAHNNRINFLYEQEES